DGEEIQRLAAGSLDDLAHRTRVSLGATEGAEVAHRREQWREPGPDDLCRPLGMQVVDAERGGRRDERAIVEVRPERRRQLTHPCAASADVDLNGDLTGGNDLRGRRRDAASRG